MVTFGLLASFYTVDAVKSKQSFEIVHYKTLNDSEKSERISWFYNVSICLSSETIANIDCKNMYDTSGWRKDYYDFGLLQNYLIE